MEHLRGKAVLITGASQGIGEATARLFGANGANVLLFARNAERLENIAGEIEAAGAKAVAVPGDVARFEDIEAGVREADERFGGLDILVNNAGLIDPIAHLADSDVEAWDHVVDVNLKGVYHGLRAGIPVMLSGEGGTIVNISSGAATSALEGWSHYCATKAAVLSLTRCAHKEYGEAGIRVVGLSPGTVDTGMQVAIRRSELNPVSQLDPSVHIPPEWAARAIAFLCGDEGAEFAGEDFALRGEEAHARVGLPAA